MVEFSKLEEAVLRFKDTPRYGKQLPSWGGGSHGFSKLRIDKSSSLFVWL